MYIFVAQAPKRPLSSYMMWLVAVSKLQCLEKLIFLPFYLKALERESLKVKYPGLKGKELVSKAGEVWKALEPEKRKVRFSGLTLLQPKM